MAAPTPPPRPGRPLAVIAILLVALYAGMFLIQSTWTPTPKLGLDLRGGTSVTLTAQAAEGEDGEITSAAMDQAKEIITARVNGTGVAEAEVAVQGDRNIVINLPEGQFDPDLLTTALLRFRPVLEVAAVTPPAAPSPSAEPSPSGEPSPPEDASPSAEPSESTTPEASEAPEDSGRAVSNALLGGQEQSPSTTPSPSDEGAPTEEPTGEPTGEPTEGGTPPTEITPEIREQFDNLTDCAAVAEERSGVIEPADELLVTCDRDGVSKFILGPVAVEGTRLDSAEAVPPQAQGNVAWIVSLRFDGEGTEQFAETTQSLVNQTPPMNQFAIVLDGTVVSAPRVNQAILTGEAVIEGDFTQDDAQDLADVLKYGALPLAFEQSELNEISPTLGADYLRVGLIAGVIGLVLVVGYLILYYRGMAITAVASLVIAAAFSYAAVVLLGEWINFTLTLAGIAGLIIAIGITADSFIVFFERLRDEVRDGRSLRAAVEHGWRRARRTILVAGTVSFLAAAVLYILAIGNVRGFAFTLGLSTVVDVFVVFLFTKPLVTLLARTKFFGRGHRWSGMDPTRLGARQAAVGGQAHTTITARRRTAGAEES